MKPKTKNIILFLARIFLFLFLAGLSYVRIINIVPLIAGILFIWKDTWKLGRVFGWILLIGNVIIVIGFYVLYLQQGGLVY